MKRNPYYQLKYISDVPYLVAFGQASADFRHDLRLNETSLFLWNELETVNSEEELVSLYMTQHKCLPEDRDSITTSVHSFIAALRHQGLLLPEDYSISGSPCATLKIAGLYCELYGKKEYFSDKLFAFETTQSVPVPELTQKISIQGKIQPHNKYGKLIMQNRELSILETSDGYCLFFPNFKCITEAHLSLDGKEAVILCKLAETEECKQESFSVMQTLFLYFAGRHNMFAIHSASVLYRDKAWLFSAASGVGKTTHTGLWHSVLNVPVLNGDINLIAINQGTPVIHGLPWCGTSETAVNGTYPLGGIILLLQGPENEYISLTDEQKLLYILHRNISPVWTYDMHESVFNLISDIYSDILVGRFKCTPAKSAVVYIQDVIDSYLSET